MTYVWAPHGTAWPRLRPSRGCTPPRPRLRPAACCCSARTARSIARLNPDNDAGAGQGQTVPADEAAFDGRGSRLAPSRGSQELGPPLRAPSPAARNRSSSPGTAQALHSKARKVRVLSRRSTAQNWKAIKFCTRRHKSARFECACMVMRVWATRGRQRQENRDQGKVRTAIQPGSSRK